MSIPLAVVLGVIIVSSSIVSANASTEIRYVKFSDNTAPSILRHYYKPDLPAVGNEITLYARIIDGVAVKNANVLYDIAGQQKTLQMSSYNTDWFVATIPSNDVKESGLKYQITAEDHYGNKVSTNFEKILVKPSPVKASLSITQSVITKTVKIVSSKSSEGFTIAITNMDKSKLENIRLMLSSELTGLFWLSEYAVRSIGTNATQNIDLKLVGNTPVDVMGEPAVYSGQIIIMAEHLPPITLRVSAGPERSVNDNAYMNSLTLKAEQRYDRAPSLNLGLLKSALSPSKPNYDVTLGQDKVIKDPEGIVTIRTLDKALKNIRIFVSSLGKQFLPMEKNIVFVGPNSEVSVPLISKIETDSSSHHSYGGELLIVPEYGVPTVIPINITHKAAKTDAFEVSTMHGKNGIYTMSEKVTIKNTGERSIDSLELMLPRELAKSFTLSKESFKKIDPGEEQIIEINFRANDIREITKNISGDLSIVSEHHSAKTIPVKLTWQKITGKHFTVYARDSADAVLTAKKLVSILDGSYEKVAETFGKINSKSIMYIVSTPDEMRNVIGTDATSFYDYTRDLIVLCGCSQDLAFDALYEHAYRTIINNNPSYWNREKMLFDGENWLVDGLARYIAAGVMGDGIVRKQVDAYAANDVELEWYGSGTQPRYGASYTFVKYLAEEYGNDVIGRILTYLGAGQISNHRCSTLENCSVLQAVYKVSGIDVNNKRHPLNFDAILDGWEEYMHARYPSVN